MKIPEGYKLVPIEPTETMIQAACLSQCTVKFETYDEWWNSHSSGISERIRNWLREEYIVMVASAPSVNLEEE